MPCPYRDVSQTALEAGDACAHVCGRNHRRGNVNSESAVSSIESAASMPRGKRNRMIAVPKPKRIGTPSHLVRQRTADGQHRSCGLGAGADGDPADRRGLEPVVVAHGGSDQPAARQHHQRADRGRRPQGSVGDRRRSASPRTPPSARCSCRTCSTPARPTSANSSSCRNCNRRRPFPGSPSAGPTVRSSPPTSSATVIWR